MDDTVDDALSIVVTSATTTNAGAAMRSAVSATGRGANTASRPAAHAIQSNDAPTRRVASLQSLINDDAAAPAVSGNVIHTMRNAHTVTGRAAPG